MPLEAPVISVTGRDMLKAFYAQNRNALHSLRMEGKASVGSIGAFAVLLEVAFARGAKVHAFFAMQLPRIRLS